MKKTTIFFLFVFLFTACSSTETASEPTTVEEKDPVIISTPNLTPFINLPPSTITPQAELLRLSGSEPISDLITFNEITRIRVNWNSTGASRFKIVFTNHDQAQVDGPYGKVTFINYNGPTQGFTEYELIAGTYTVEIAEAGGPWEVWVEQLP